MPQYILNGNSQDNYLLGLSGYENTINGKGGNDLIFGAELNDIINGGDGNDWIEAGAGDDTIKGGTGNDTMFGHEGNDTITESNANLDWDIIGGGAGNDTIHAGGGDDWVGGGADNDIIFLDDGNDQYYATVLGDIESGNDEIHGGNGNDIINTSYGNDIAYGDAGADTIIAFNYDSEGNITANVGDVVTVYGGGNNDLIFTAISNNANTYNDYTLIADGGNGSDQINSLYVNSFITAGSGSDTVYISDGAFNYEHTVDLGTGNDEVRLDCTVSGTITTGEGKDIITLYGFGSFYDTSVVTVTDFTALSDEVHASGFSSSQCTMNDNGIDTILLFANAVGMIFEVTLTGVTGYTVNDLVDFV